MTNATFQFLSASGMALSLIGSAHRIHDLEVRVNVVFSWRASLGGTIFRQSGTGLCG
jgi:hypothetical protein